MRSFAYGDSRTIVTSVFFVLKCIGHQYPNSHDLITWRGVVCVAHTHPGTALTVGSCHLLQMTKSNHLGNSKAGPRWTIDVSLLQFSEFSGGLYVPCLLSFSSNWVCFAGLKPKYLAYSTNVYQTGALPQALLLIWGLWKWTKWTRLQCSSGLASSGGKAGNRYVLSLSVRCIHERSGTERQAVSQLSRFIQCTHSTFERDLRKSRGCLLWSFLS